MSKKKIYQLQDLFVNQIMYSTILTSSAALKIANASISSHKIQFFQRIIVLFAQKDVQLSTKKVNLQTHTQDISFYLFHLSQAIKKIKTLITLIS